MLFIDIYIKKNFLFICESNGFLFPVSEKDINNLDTEDFINLSTEEDLDTPQKRKPDEYDDDKSAIKKRKLDEYNDDKSATNKHKSDEYDDDKHAINKHKSDEYDDDKPTINKHKSDEYNDDKSATNKHKSNEYDDDKPAPNKHKLDEYDDDKPSLKKRKLDEYDEEYSDEDYNTENSLENYKPPKYRGMQDIYNKNNRHNEMKRYKRKSRQSYREKDYDFDDRDDHGNIMLKILIYLVLFISIVFGGWYSYKLLKNNRNNNQDQIEEYIGLTFTQRLQNFRNKIHKDNVLVGGQETTIAQMLNIMAHNIHLKDKSSFFSTQIFVDNNSKDIEGFYKEIEDKFKNHKEALPIEMSTDKKHFLYNLFVLSKATDKIFDKNMVIFSSNKNKFDEMLEKAFLKINNISHVNELDQKSQHKINEFCDDILKKFTEETNTYFFNKTEVLNFTEIVEAIYNELNEEKGLDLLIKMHNNNNIFIKFLEEVFKKLKSNSQNGIEAPNKKKKKKKK